MDWQRFYVDELAAPGTRAVALRALERHRPGDAAIVAALRAGGIASFPHVTLRDSADPIARVVQSILALDARRVVALGVLHGGALPPGYRDEHAALAGTGPRADAAFARLGGAFLGSGSVPTPFGVVDDAPIAPVPGLVRCEPAILAGEFSLDLFLALLAAAAHARGVRAPPVTRLYVAATRATDGGFGTAVALAEVLAGLVETDTVCVATGDLAHLGNGYDANDDADRWPAEPMALHAAVALEIDAMHAAALARQDAPAWAAGTRLKSDQRHLLPVIAAHVGPGASAERLSLQLSDYAAINGVPPPSLVAASLVLFRPALPRAARAP